MRPILWTTALMLAMTSVRAADVPRRFAFLSGTEHVLVILYDDGTAAYSSRLKMGNHPDEIFAASRASWRWCGDPPAEKNVPRCLNLFVSGADEQGEAGYRINFLYRDDKLVEFDEGGFGKTLLRIKERQ
jgi:hypothetical protein